MSTIKMVAAILAVLALGALVDPAPVAAHCDSVEGPVVKAAEAALVAGDVELVLMWVLPDDEPEIRKAFDRTLRAREAGGDTRELADRWFYETVVRVHRMGEGAAYTGLKPAGYQPPAGIAAADHVLEAGSVGPLADRLTHGLHEALAERYERALALRDHDPRDVEAGREYVHAYVEYIHFVEALHALISGHGEHTAATGEAH